MEEGQTVESPTLQERTEALKKSDVPRTAGDVMTYLESDEFIDMIARKLGDRVNANY